MLSDIEIAQQAKMMHIRDVAAKAGIAEVITRVAASAADIIFFFIFL